MDPCHALIPSSAHRILVIDDNAAIHDDIRKLFEPESTASSELLALGAEVFFDDEEPSSGVVAVAVPAARFVIDSALQGRQGFDMVCDALDRGEPYAVAFVDMRMPPGWDGMETIARIRQRDPELQIVICTAYSDHSWAEILSQLGNDDGVLVLKKPFDGIELTQMAHALGEKWSLRGALVHRLSDLEEIVGRRTRELAETNELLRQEIVDREKVEATLRLSQKLESIGRLAAGVAHEINNPLAYIAGNLEYVADELTVAKRDEPFEWDKVLEAIGDARQGTARVGDIVRSLKTFARAEDDKCGPLSVAKVMGYALGVVGSQIRHRARLSTELGDVPPVSGNEGRLAQVFVNLLVNAAQAIPEGAVHEHEIKVVTRLDARGHVVIEVHDSGVGISADLKRSIFDPFFTTKPIGVGMGLGLAICHGIVEGMGGEIAVDSEVGIGSVFRLVLPPAASASPSITPRTTRAAGSAGSSSSTRPSSTPSVLPVGVLSGKPARVLIVDDEVEMCVILRRLLSPIHDVTAVSSSREALQRLRDGERFDVILCDVMMPELTGIELYEALRLEAPEQSERLRFFSGGVFTEHAARFVETFSHPILPKPFGRSEVRRVVAEVVATRAE